MSWMQSQVYRVAFQKYWCQLPDAGMTSSDTTYNIPMRSEASPDVCLRGFQLCLAASSATWSPAQATVMKKSFQHKACMLFSCLRVLTYSCWHAAAWCFCQLVSALESCCWRSGKFACAPDELYCCPNPMLLCAGFSASCLNWPAMPRLLGKLLKLAWLCRHHNLIRWPSKNSMSLIIVNAKQVRMKQKGDQHTSGDLLRSSYIGFKI